jgi:uncharacterized repeat protein (TIGR03847 family)
MSENIELGDVDYLTVAAIGPQGERAFFIQARSGESLCTMKVEKRQVSVLATYFSGVIKDLERTLGPPVHVPQLPDLVDIGPPDLVVGSFEVSFDLSNDRFHVAAKEIQAEETEEEEGAARATMNVTRAQAAAFAIEGERLVEAGRPSCPFCGYPLDVRGHVCPKMNGQHAPLT